MPVLIGLVMQALLALSLYKGWKTFGQNSFYLITMQLMWCDVCALALDLYVAFPLTLTGVQYMGESIPLYYGPLFFEGIAFNGMFILSFFLTTNRFLLFIFPNLHAKIFTTRGTKIMSLLVWIYIFLFIALSNVFGCTKQFSKEYFYFWYNCSNRVPGKFHYNDFMNIQSYAIPSAMMFMYVVIYVKLRLSPYGSMKNDITRIKQEVKYLVQTVLICFLIGVEVAAFITLPFLNASGYAQFYLNILLNLLIVINNLVTPIVLFSFNWEIRSCLKQALCSHRGSTGRSTTLSVIQIKNSKS
ncbi:hypothetical protein ANCDUO_05345 [Ancylostoma duodenale]|uniref:G-protein coupled receptors family 1 profile domain-containing protein n=1 Tax=Ancylostoma duodenale TaxID=51022 RepID=A0A0C2GSV0_9BILA|nr:hypothetical protein ANCDUO_05345 [Ancylostoma duodenale]